jgi:hypothetical protein
MFIKAGASLINLYHVTKITGRFGMSPCTELYGSNGEIIGCIDGLWFADVAEIFEAHGLVFKMKQKATPKKPRHRRHARASDADHVLQRLIGDDSRLACVRAMCRWCALVGGRGPWLHARAEEIYRRVGIAVATCGGERMDENQIVNVIKIIKQKRIALIMADSEPALRAMVALVTRASKKARAHPESTRPSGAERV